jgi:hypothetical protein
MPALTYNSIVTEAGTARPRLAQDSTREIEDRQVAIWRSLTTVEIGALVAGASRAARAMTMAGLRTRYPRASDHELLMRYARLTLGRELATRVYPELDRLDE